MMGIQWEAGPPGAYTLAAIEREVDYGKLPQWRREALEWVRSQVDGGTLKGEVPDLNYRGDRVELELFVELEARLEDTKHFIPERLHHVRGPAGRQPPLAMPRNINSPGGLATDDRVGVERSNGAVYQVAEASPSADSAARRAKFQKADSDDKGR
jgi:hypothetical protein